MSELRADTITASDGTGPVTLTKQHAAKAWINFDGTATGALADYDRDSFNMSVITDNGTGDHTLGFTNNMGNANYCGVSGGQTNNVASFSIHHTFVTTFTASSLRVLCNDGSAGANNWALTTVVVHGDLA